LSIQGIELVGVLDQPPKELRDVFREPGRLPVASVFAEPALWQPAVGPVMTRLSLKVRWWQLGDDSDVSFYYYPPGQTGGDRETSSNTASRSIWINWRWIYVRPKRAASAPRRGLPSYSRSAARRRRWPYLQLPAAALRAAAMSEPRRASWALTNVFDRAAAARPSAA
jgi:hypothetical protein